MEHSRRLKRLFLYLLVASVSFTAILGIVLVLRNTWGWLEVRVILTTITVAVASVCGLACDLSRTTRGSNLFPISGLVLTIVAAGMILVGIWFDVDAEAYWKTSISVSIFAVATAHICLLSIARLASRFRWVFPVACQIIFGLAILLAVIVIWEIDMDRMFRFVAAVSILDAAITVVIPILHRLRKTDPNSSGTLSHLDQTNVDSIDDEISRLKKRISELERLKAKVARGGHNI